MKKIFSLFAAVLFAGAMMATDVEVIIHASSGDYYAKTNDWKNSTQYDQVVLDANITANRIGTGNNGKYYSDWRFYTNGSDEGSFSIDAAEGYELQSVKITWTASNSGALYLGENKVTSNEDVAVSGQKVVFTVKNTNTATNGQARVTKIAVTYKEASGTTPPEKTLPVVALAGGMNEWSATANVMVPAEDSLTASVKVALEAGKVEFKIVSDGKWLSLNGEGEALYGFHREWTSVSHVNGVDLRNFELTADVAGDYTFTWTYADSTLAITFPEKQENPIVGCEWDKIEWIADGSPEQTFGSQFKVCTTGEYPGIVNIQKPGFATKTGIYMTFPSAVFGTISLAEEAYDMEGAGIIFHVDAFTAKETEVTVNCESKDIVFTVYNAKGGETPVTHTYTVAGGSAVAFGTTWDPANAANDLILQSDGSYKWEKADLTLPAGAVEFKVVEDHAWAVAYPADNYSLAITEAGVYTIQILFDPATKEVTANAIKTGSAEVDPTVSVKGGWDSWANEVVFTLAEDKLTATATKQLEAGNYEFKVILNGSDWRANGYTYHREYTGAEGITGNGDNMVLQADKAGDYTFTWTFATNALNITFPTIGTGIENTAVDGKATKLFRDGQMLIIRGEHIYTASGQMIQ